MSHADHHRPGMGGGGGRDGRILEVEFLSDDESSHENIDWQHVHRRKFLDLSMKEQWHSDSGLLMSKTPLQYASWFQKYDLKANTYPNMGVSIWVSLVKKFDWPSQVPPNILISSGEGPSITFFHMEIKAESSVNFWLYIQNKNTTKQTQHKTHYK